MHIGNRRYPRLKQAVFCSGPRQATPNLQSLSGDGWQRIPNPDVTLFLPTPELRATTGLTGKETSATLRLPTTRTGPLPSPELSHTWELDKETPPSLAPWTVYGIGMTPVEEVQAFLGLSANGPDSKTHFGLAASFHFWSRAAALVLETLATHKLLPVLVPIDADGKIFHARWLPVLDSPRLAQLETAMPPAVARRLLPKRKDHLREACSPALLTLPVTLIL